MGHHCHFLFINFPSTFPSCIFGHPKHIITYCNPCGSSPDVIREISPCRKSTNLDVPPFNYFSMLLRGVHGNHFLTPCQNLPTTKSIIYKVNYQLLTSWFSPSTAYAGPYKTWYQQTPFPRGERCSVSTTGVYQHLCDTAGHNSSFKFTQIPWRVKNMAYVDGDTPR